MVVWFVTIARARHRLDRQRAGRADGDRPAARGRVLPRATACTASPCSAPCSWSSPAAKRCTPTWDTSASGRSGIAWFALVLPALLLNYFGQGALLLLDPTAAEQPFFLLAPAWALLPLVGLATAAAIIASQALISGAFSLTRQAIQLGYCPRLDIDHTSSLEIGQVYVPQVNWALMSARSSSSSASARRARSPPRTASP